MKIKPGTEVADLIRRMSSLTCKPFFVPRNVRLQGRQVTVIAPEVMTAGQAYRLFLAALDSVNLTVQPDERFLRIVELGRGDPGGQPAAAASASPAGASGPRQSRQ
jgi:general secretion pathway protein D